MNLKENLTQCKIKEGVLVMANIYTTKSGDMWDMIALKVLGNEMYMSELIENNYKYRNVMIFEAGIKLNIPEISTQKVKNLPPWKR